MVTKEHFTQCNSVAHLCVLIYISFKQWISVAHKKGFGYTDNNCEINLLLVLVDSKNPYPISYLLV